MEQFNQFIAEKFYYLFLGILAVYIIMRMRNQHSMKKRQIVFYIAIGVFLTYTAAIFPAQGMLPLWFTPIILVAVIVGEVLILKNKWIFKRDCAVCGTKLDWNTTLMDDRNTCSDCLVKAEQEASETDTAAADGVDSSADIPSGDDD